LICRTTDIEIKKIKDDAATIIRFLNEKIGLRIMDSSFINTTEKALNLTWTRDPFDRIIVADAILNKGKLITADKTIRKHYEHSYC
jgi:PIN domain nuclease of toxin-antitoxin system